MIQRGMLQKTKTLISFFSIAIVFLECNFSSNLFASTSFYEPNKLIYLAIIDKNTEALEKLLKKGDLANKKDLAGRTPLHIAALTCNNDAARILVRYGATLAVRNNHGKTPFDYINCDGAKNPDELLEYLKLEQLKEISEVTKHGNLEKLRALFDEGYASKTVLLDNNKTILHVAAEYNQIKIVEYLVEEVPGLLVSKDSTGKTPKDYVSAKINPSLAEFLEKSTSNLRKNGEILIFNSAYDISGDKTRKLSAQTKDFILNDLKNRNIRDVEVTTLPENENTEFLPNFRYREYNENQFKQGEFIIGKTTRITFREPLLITTEAHQLNNIASRIGALENAKIGNTLGLEHSLVGFEINKNAQNELRETPLHLAAKFGHFDAVKYLVNIGASLDILAENGKTAHDYAVENGHSNVADFLANEEIESTSIGASLKREFLPPDLFGLRIDPNKYDTRIGNMKHFESILNRFTHMTSAHDNILKVLNFGKRNSDDLIVARAKGALYELEVAEVLARRGEIIEGFGLKYSDNRNQTLQVKKEFDLQTSAKLIEVKSIGWKTLIDQEAIVNWKAIEDEEKLKEFFLIHRDIASQGSRIFEFHSKQPIPGRWEKWFKSENIPAFTTQLPSID